MEQSETILAIQMHAPQRIEGKVLGFAHAEALGLTMEIVEKGVRIRGPKTNKLVPFANIQGIDFKEQGHPMPVVQRK